MKISLSKFNIWSTFAILVALNVLDAASTAILVHQFGPDVEANPIVRYYIELFGIAGIYMIKFSVLAFIGFAIYVVNHHSAADRRATIYMSMWVLNVIFAFVVINNIILVVNTINT